MHCQPIIIMYTVTSDDFQVNDMTWEIDEFLLDDTVKLFYSVRAYQLNSINIYAV